MAEPKDLVLGLVGVGVGVGGRGGEKAFQGELVFSNETVKDHVTDKLLTSLVTPRSAG